MIEYVYGIRINICSKIASSPSCPVTTPSPAPPSCTLLCGNKHYVLEPFKLRAHWEHVLPYLIIWEGLGGRGGGDGEGAQLGGERGGGEGECAKMTSEKW